MLIESQSEQQLDILERLDAYADSIEQRIVNKILSKEVKTDGQERDIQDTD